MKPGIAFFDFDGTITTKDTLLEFIRYSKGTALLYTGFLFNAPYLIAFKLGIISNQSAKEKILAWFFGKMPVKEFEDLCTKFSVNQLPSLIRKGAIDEIKKLQQHSIEVVVVSASPQNWISQWAAAMNLLLIATKLEIVNNQLTGKIEGANCYGEEKVRRIREQFQLDNYKEIYAYGDTLGDKPMLSLAHHPHMKPFR
jgi:phosphatidylglycerophosphatase C